MTPTSRLDDARSSYLSQRQIQWRDARHLQTLSIPTACSAARSSLLAY